MAINTNNLFSWQNIAASALNNLNQNPNGSPSGGQPIVDTNLLFNNKQNAIPVGAMTASQHAVTTESGKVRNAAKGEITAQANGQPIENISAKGFMNSKVGKFGGQYGGVIGDAASAIGNIIGKRGLDGKYGGITKGMDAAYDTIQKAASNFGPIGNIVSGAMGVGKLVGNAVSKIGGGTDGMTKTDAVLNSAFLNLTPLGLINGFGGKKTNTYTRNAELDKSTNGGFQGFLTTQDITQIGAGKKYGLLSSGARNKQNQLTEFTSNMKHTVSGIVDTNTINNLAAQGSTPFIANQQSVDLSGGVQQMRAARQGMKVEKYKKPANPFKLKQYSRPKGVKNLSPKPYGPEGMIQLYDKDGNPTRGLTRAQELGYEPVIKYNGKAGFIGYDSNPALPYMLRAKNTILDKKGGQMIRRIVSKYQVGNKLKRTFKTIDVATGKYVEIPRDLDKDQIKGRTPIRLYNGTVVFMNDDGTVTSDRWEVIGQREHLTPKGQEGLELQQVKNINLPEIEIISEKEKLPEWLFFDENNNRYVSTFNKASSKEEIKMLENFVKSKLKNWKVWQSDRGQGTYFVVPKEVANYLGWKYLQDLNEGSSGSGMKPLKVGDIIKHPESGVKIKYVGDDEQTKEGVPMNFIDEDGNGYYLPGYQKGGQMNVIPEGALHARLNHLDQVNDDLTHVTTKGIPVITKEGGEVVQHAEIEHSEIIFTLDVTNKIEDLRKKWHEDKEDKYAIEAGKLLVKEILHNTDDRTNLIESVE